MALSTRNQIIIAAVAVMLLAVLSLYFLRSRPVAYLDKYQEDWTPEEALSHYLESLEDGDLQAVINMTMDRDHPALLDETQSHSRDDLIATGLDIRQEEYALKEVKGDHALFYSPKSALFLAMTREEKVWKLDVQRTNQLNGEHAPAASPAASPSAGP